MSIDLPGHTAPTAGFTAPLEMLSVCHYGIERQCLSLGHLVSHLGSRGADAKAHTAAAELMRCFDTSAKQLHAEEEEDLFPALIESMAGSDAVCLTASADVLTADPREIEVHWRRVRSALERVVAGGRRITRCRGWRACRGACLPRVRGAPAAWPAPRAAGGCRGADPHRRPGSGRPGSCERHPVGRPCAAVRVRAAVAESHDRAVAAPFTAQYCLVQGQPLWFDDELLPVLQQSARALIDA